MNVLLGLLCFLLGISIWILAISVLVAWLTFCFGSPIIGLLLLFFMPYALLAPLAIGVPGTALFVYGMDKLVNRKGDSFFHRG